jgi:WS/DGAT/MGAT family acyltransferase
MSIERLSAEDRIMLWGDEVWPQEVGALAVLDGSGLLDPDGRFKLEVVREAVEDRLHLVPRFRQLLYTPRRGLGGPLWVDAPAFDLREHVQLVPLPAPADEAQLLIATERLRRRRLDRSRPLWGMWLLPGLAGGRIGLFVKMHHVIGDGIAGVATLGRLLDSAPEATAVPGRPWAPAPLPPARALLTANLGRHVEELGRAFSKLARPGTALQHVRAAWPAMRELFSEEPPTQTSLDQMVGPDRSLALIRSHLDLVKEVAHAHDAKVNDVLLAATAGGLRRLLRDRGEQVDDVTVRIAVPVSLRQGQVGASQGNLVGEMLVPLPIGLSDPSRRLRQIAASTAERKTRTPASVGTVLRSRIARRVMVKALDHQRLNVTSADVPGPPLPLYLAGARVLEAFPLLPLIWKVSLGVGAMSYAGQFNVMAVADRATCPDLDVLAAGMGEELHALGMRSSREPLVPSSSRPNGVDDA